MKSSWAPPLTLSATCQAMAENTQEAAREIPVLASRCHTLPIGSTELMQAQADLLRARLDYEHWRSRQTWWMAYLEAHPDEADRPIASTLRKPRKAEYAHVVPAREPGADDVDQWWEK